MSLIGWNHFERFPKKVVADHKFWWSFLQRNFDSVLNILVGISNNLHCIVCADLSRNYSSKGSLASHIRSHRVETVNYYLDNVIQIEPEDLESMLE